MSFPAQNMLNPTHNQLMNMNPNTMIDSIKSLVLTMVMVKGTTGATNGENSMINTVLLMIAVSFIDTIVNLIKSFISYMSRQFNLYVASKTKKIPLITNNFISQKSSILIKIEPASKNPTSDAVIDLLTNLPQTKAILLQGGIYEINYAEEIEISNKLYAKMSGSSKPNLNTTNSTEQQSNEQNQSLTTTNNQTPGNEYGYIEIYSHSLDMEKLRAEVDNIVKNYLIKISNKLGNNIYYFSEIPTKVYRDSTGQVDYSKIPDTLFFSMKRFTTNRSFKNLFGKNIDIIRKRVNFFKDNKDWYDDKGVPYTLGIMVSGNPGSGKTSIIKCISNELKRHIINIHLSDNMTKSQLENLFYSEQINILQNGKTETYTIPINKRIYVFEDIDCQCDIILDRASDTVEQLLIKKNEELRKQIEELKIMVNDKANQTKVIGNNQNKHSEEDRKADNSSQKITLSFILNLFDGILETPGRITIMTTNFVDKLDKAFTRPGRIDVIGKFGFSDAQQLIQIIEHRYDTKLTDDQLNLIYNIPQCITPAEIGRILFENFTDLNGALHSLMAYSESYLIAEQEKIAKSNKNKAIVNAIDDNNEQKVKELIEEVSDLVKKEGVEEKKVIEDGFSAKYVLNPAKQEEEHHKILNETHALGKKAKQTESEMLLVNKANNPINVYPYKNPNNNSINKTYALGKKTNDVVINYNNGIQFEEANKVFMPNDNTLFSGKLQHDTYSTEYGTEIKN